MDPSTPSSGAPDPATLASLLEASPTATLTFDASGRVLFASSLAVALLGRPLVGERAEEILPGLAEGDSRTRFTMLLGAATADTARFEATVSRPDGSELPLELRVRRWTAGGEHAAIGRVLECQERSSSEVELQRLREFHRSVLDLMSSAVFVIGPGGVFERVNRAACLATGYPEAELVGHHFAKVVRPNRLEETTGAFVRALEGVPVEGFPTEIARNGGEVRALLINLRPWFDNGRIAGIVGSSEDVTERRRAEAARDELSRMLELSNQTLSDGRAAGIQGGNALPVIGHLVDAMMGRSGAAAALTPEAFEDRIAEDDRLRDMLDVASVMVAVKDGEGRHLLVNRRFEQLTGFSRAEVQGKPDAEIYPATLAAELRANDLAVLRSEQPGEFEESYGSGTEARTFMVVKFPLRNERGEVAGVCAIGTEITDRKRMEEALRDQAEKLARADRRKDEFLAILGHELRNPLAAIRSAVELAGHAIREPDTGGPGLPAAERALATINRQMGQLVSLVDDLLDVGRITAGRIVLRRETIELTRVVASACEPVAALAEANGQLVRVSLPEDPVWVDGDPLRLQQVLVNLLQNALRYSDPQAVVDLEATLEGARVAIGVRDSGAGISAAALPHLFEPFHRGDREGEATHQGLGIGLSLVRSLTELHGGTVSATSAGLGKGAEFVVRLPVACAPSAVSPDVVARSELASRRALRILVADDNEDAAEGLATLLRISGHEVETALDGPGALACAEHGHHDVAILDIGMPGLDGYEVARRLRALPEGGPRALVALTGYAHDDARERVRAAGFDRHLVKPVEPATLEATLAEIVPA